MIENADRLTEVRDAWAETLGIEPDEVPLEENFLEVGGNSLLLLLLWEQLNELTTRELRAADLFEHATVRAQAALLDAPEEEHKPVVRGATERGRLLGRAR
ncbi:MULTISPECIES: acyl carrier protein [unclassified Streptomyces]|uniref:acyl carrier protein n=1 Tax=unclassified Streptomyces TaxID=2593676 RepID=UPI0033F8B0AB